MTFFPGVVAIRFVPDEGADFDFLQLFTHRALLLLLGERTREHQLC
jgi:hypothetical protein